MAAKRNPGLMGIRRTALAILLAGFMAGSSGPLFAKPKGAEVRVDLLNHGRVTGELIAVRADAIIVKNVITEMTVDVAKIDKITISPSGSGFGIGETLGFVAGAAAGYSAGLAYARWHAEKYDSLLFPVPVLGLLGGGLLGEVLGRKVTTKERVYKISGEPPEEVAKILAKLKQKARMPRAL